MPRALRSSVATMVTSLPPDSWTSLFSSLPFRLRPPEIGDKLYKIASVLTLDSADAVYRRLISHWEPSELMPQARELRGILYDKSLLQEFLDLLERMQLLDLVTYLPDDILTKVDRASMAVEARLPLLDHRVVEFSWRLPRAAKVRRNSSKRLLRQILHRYVPPALVKLRRWALEFRWANGCAARCATGPRRC